MKTKHAFLLMILLSMGSWMYSQVSLGLKAGATFATIPMDDSYLGEDETNGYLLGYQAGIMAEIPITAWFSIQPELLYLQKGTQTREEYEEFYVDPPYYSYEYEGVFRTQVRQQAFDLPILGKFILGQGNTRFFFLAGPHFSYMTRTNIVMIDKGTTTTTELDGKGNTVTESENLYEVYGSRLDYKDEDIQKAYNRYDIGGTAGAGVDVAIGCGNRLLFDLRYNMGFIDFNNWNNRDYDKPDNYKPWTNRFFNASVAYVFSLGTQTPK